MIHREFCETRADGVRLYRTYSDADVMINKVGSDELYSEAIDIDDIGYIYKETDVPAETDTEPTAQDMLTMLGELGVDIDAQP